MAPSKAAFLRMRLTPLRGPSAQWPSYHRIPFQNAASSRPIVLQLSQSLLFSSTRTKNSFRGRTRVIRRLAAPIAARIAFKCMKVIIGGVVYIIVAVAGAAGVLIMTAVSLIEGIRSVLTELTPVKEQQWLEDQRMDILATVRKKLGYKGPHYKPLAAEDKIRVFVLQPGRYEDELQCHLEHRTSLVNGGYEALSYVWGSPRRPGTIQVSGSEAHITQSLDKALRRLRRRDRPRVLWVDALCINQGDEKEKSSQVRMMQHIYANADQVVIWLGEDRKEDDFPFDYFDYLSNILDDVTHPSITHFKTDFRGKHDWQEDVSMPTSPKRGDTTTLMAPIWPLYNLLRRDWFQRTWIVQEVATSKKAVIMCGAKVITWDSFADVCLRYPDLNRTVRQLEESRHGQQFSIHPHSFHECRRTRYDLLESGIAHISLQNIAAIERIRRERKDGSRSNTLFEVLLATAFNRCTDERDKIFGVLGLADDHSQIGGLTPTYDAQITVQHVFSKFAIWDIQNSGSLRVLSCADARVPLQFMPSWVPAWGYFRNTHPFTRYSQRTQFRASGGSTAKFTIASDGVLEVTGRRIDIVQAIGPKFKPKLGTGVFSVEYGYLEQLHEVHKWLEACKSLAGARVPGRFDQFWLTMTCGLTGQGDPVPTSYAKHFSEYLEFVEGMWENMPRGGTPIKISQYNAFRLSGQTRKNFELIESSISRWSSKRRLCTTENRRLACVPPKAKPGDIICVLYGGEVPYVLRSIPQSGYYIVIGECYVHGIMHGEALKAPHLRDEIFCLH